MIAPTIPEQLAVLRDFAKEERSPARVNAQLSESARLATIRRADVLTYIADRIEIFANKAAAARREPSA